MIQETPEVKPPGLGLRRLRTAAGLVRQVWLAVGLTLLLLAAAEAAARLVLLARRPAVDPRAHADAYAAAPWVAELYAEARQTRRMRWEPYVYWRRAPFAGRFINIDQRGLRRTWQPPQAAASPADLPRVFFFGGSMAWGSGVRDDHTVPSELARWLAAHGAPVLVTNYGESGYVSTQSLLVLLRELQRGAVPDVVVLFGGAIDVASAAEEAGNIAAPLHEFHREREFDLLRHARRLVPAAMRVAASRSALVELTGLGPPRELPPPPPPPFTPAIAETVARAVEANRHILAALAASYGFRLLWVWEPSILEKPQLTAYERSQLSRLDAPLRDGLPLLLRRLRRATGAAGSGGPSDRCELLFLSDLFATISAPRFIDQSHLSETGNLEVAAAIGGRLLATGGGRLRHPAVRAASGAQAGTVGDLDTAGGSP